MVGRVRIPVAGVVVVMAAFIFAGNVFAKTASYAAVQTYATHSGAQAIASVDLNRDGRPDVVAANVNLNDVSVLLDNANGTLQAKVDYAAATSGTPFDLTAGDVNGDGKPDVVTANFSTNNVSVLLGNGDGTLQAHQEYAAGTQPIGVAIGDVNKDGKPDLVVTTFNNMVAILLGNGDGSFQAPTTTFACNSPRTPAVADLNRDGKPDVVVPCLGNDKLVVLLGNGDGTLQSAVSYPTHQAPAAVSIADFNHDGKLDAAAPASAVDEAAVLLGNGDGTLQAAVHYSVGTTPDGMEAVDVNLDGNVDLVTANTASNNVSVLPGNGDGTFQAHQDFAAGSGPYGIVSRDYNGDGWPDLAVADTNASTVGVLLESVDLSRPGNFGPATNTATAGGSYSVATGDFNRDGNQDVVSATFGSNVSVMLGNGNGTLQAKVDYTTHTTTVEVQVGDFNRDGKLDIAAVCQGSNDVSILLGNGDGTFQTHQDFTVGTTPYRLAVGDLNHDGKPDLVVGNYSSNNVSVLIGAGDGTFATHVDYAAGGAGAHTIGVALGDFNRDGNLDVAATNFDGNNVAVLLGVGDGTLNAHVDYSTGANTQPDGVAVGDLNGDGKLDLAVADYTAHQIGVFNGVGDGTFGLVTNYNTGVGADYDVRIADLNADGKLDVVEPDFGSNQVVFMLGTGSGFNAPVALAAGSNPGGIAVSDLNNDGKPDLVSGNAFSNNVSVFMQFGALDHFTVEASGGGSIGTQTAGGSFNAKLTARDDGGAVVANYSGTVDVTSTQSGCTAGCVQSAAFSSGVLSSHAVTLTKAQAQALHVVSHGGVYGTDPSGASNSFTVNPGALDHFQVVAHGGGAIGTQTAGSAFAVDVTAQDAFDNTQTGYTSTVDITSDSSCAAGCGTSPAFTAGVLSNRSITLTGAASGLHVQVAGGGPGGASGQSNAFTVNPAAANHVTFTSATTDLVSGADRDLMAEIRDQYENLIDSSANVTFLKSGGPASLTGLGTVAAVHGVATKTVTGAAAGAISLSAASAGLSDGTSGFTVVPGAANHVTFTSSTMQLASSSPRTLTAEIRDLFGNKVDTSASVTFAKASGAGTVAGLGTVAAVHGLASKSVTGITAGTISLTASSAGLTDGTSAFTVIAGPATKLVFTSARTALASGTARVLSVTVQDAHGNKSTSPAHTVAFAKTSGAGTVTGLGSGSSRSGIATKSVLGAIAGTIVIRATSTGLTAGTTSFTVTPGAAKKLVFTNATTALKVGLSRTLVAEVRDAAGNRVKTPSKQVTFSKASGTGTLTGLPATVASSSGLASKSVKATKAGSMSIKATATGLTAGTTVFSITT